MSELVDLLGCDGPEDVRVLVDAVAEASGRAVRKLRPKGSEEIRAYRLIGSMKCELPVPLPRFNRLNGAIAIFVSPIAFSPREKKYPTNRQQTACSH